MSQPRSKLLELLLDSPAHRIMKMPPPDFGLSDEEPFPFIGIVGQEEMKLSLLLSVINPRVGGVLLIGPRGTAKTTAVRGLPDLLPLATRSLCVYGCTEELVERDGIEAICDDCAKKYAYEQPLTVQDRVRLFELPLNARLDDVVGGVNERIALEQSRMRLERGILGHADGHLLYIDEVNLLDDVITDAILDASAQGHYTVRRGSMKARYRARFILIGSMNPEEGSLRPQLMDRFGLRAVVRGLTDMEARFEAYQRVVAYRQDPDLFMSRYAGVTLTLAEEVQQARARLPQVTISSEAQRLGLNLVNRLHLDSSRAEITLFEAARAHAASDERLEVDETDVRAVAKLALRQRTSTHIQQFFHAQAEEDAEIETLLETS